VAYITTLHLRRSPQISFRSPAPFRPVLSIKLALFGFVFPGFKCTKFLVIPCLIDVYIHLLLPEIGFVFSNWIMLNAVISNFELRASDFRPMAGILALFFQIAFCQTQIYTD
jgi:hypothetical protein